LTNKSWGPSRHSDRRETYWERIRRSEGKKSDRTAKQQERRGDVKWQWTSERQSASSEKSNRKIEEKSKWTKPKKQSRSRWWKEKWEKMFTMR
jgi:hypothetical protein